MAATSLVARGLSDGARRGALELDALRRSARASARCSLAGAIEAPFVGAVRHHAETRIGVRELQRELAASASSAAREHAREPRALVFTDTFAETNGVAGTMRRLAARRRTPASCRCRSSTAAPAGRRTRPGPSRSPPDWSLPLPGYEALDMRFPLVTDVLAFVEREQPDAIHVATPGPVGLCGLAAAQDCSGCPSSARTTPSSARTRCT